MARRIVWTEPAVEDLEAAARYIATDSPRYAAAVVSEAQEAARSLKRFAERGRIVPEFEDPTLRELFVRSFRLIYRIAVDAVYVLGFIHAARDIRRV
ncbi:MAG: type II toxin-antitoxin system RelE/ParE family toxin [Acidobacteriota bacterium]